MHNGLSFSLMSVSCHKLLLWLTGICLAISLWGCSSTKHVPQGKYLVDDVNIKIVDNSEVKESELVNYLRQTPNHKVLGFMKLQLATYNISGSDTTKWFNRWVRRLDSRRSFMTPSLLTCRNFS